MCVGLLVLSVGEVGRCLFLRLRLSLSRSLDLGFAILQYRHKNTQMVTDVEANSVWMFDYV